MTSRDSLSVVVEQGGVAAAPAALAESAPRNVVRLRHQRRSLRSVSRRKLSVLLVGLHSSRYAVGENHGLSVLAGVLEARPDLIRSVRVVDMGSHPDAPADHVAETIRAAAVDVVGIALPQGTYSLLRDAYPSISPAVEAAGTRVVFGGALADQLIENLLALDPAAVVVRGEGEVAWIDMLHRWAEGVEDLHGIPGVAFVADGVVVTAEPMLTNLDEMPPPARSHVVGIAEAGGQVYAESSRTWPSGPAVSEPYARRRFPARRLALDFERLCELGITSVKLADADFLGPDLAAIETHIEELRTYLLPGRLPSFELSTTTRSLYRHSDDAQTNATRAHLLVQLREIGLEKVLLDIGSGSDGQLRRHDRTYLAEESAAAIYRIRAAGLQLEVGLVIFDPLCTVDEVAENVAFIRRTGTAGALRSVAGELVLQKGSRYLEGLERHERATGRTLYQRGIDLDTLTHAYSYASDDIARLVNGIRPAAQAQHAISSPIAAASRLSRGTASAELSAVLARWKDAVLCAVEAGIHAVHAGQDPQAAAEEAMIEAGWTLASDLIGTQRRLPPSLREHPTLVTALQLSRQFIDDPRPPRPATEFKRRETASDA